ncbi:MAG: ABC transporter substrate-binding protein [Clostridia bacterium]|nr:ABC transporter substrate-binding protein [Clostridia bacterium]
MLKESKKNSTIRRIALALLAVIIAAAMLASCQPANSTEPEDDYVLKVGALSGPTGMGMAKLISDTKEGGKSAGKYEITIYSSPDEIRAALISGTLDVAALPVNLAAVINTKTEGKYKVAAVNTLGVLYVLEAGNTINSIADLAGKKLYATGQASTPEYILNYILEKNGLDNVEVEYKTEHSELAALLISGQATLGMLPEPMVTNALSKNENLRIALNLTEEWKKVSDGEAVQGCISVSTDVISSHKAVLDSFLDEYKASVEFVNANPDEASKMIADAGIVAAEAVARKALPNCNIVYIDGNEMVSILTEFYGVLYAANPASVGGKMPDSELYYKK